MSYDLRSTVLTRYQDAVRAGDKLESELLCRALSYIGSGHRELAQQILDELENSHGHA